MTQLLKKQIVIRDSAANPHGDLLRAVLGATDYGFLLTDCDHMTIACNARFGELFGFDPQDAVRSNARAVRAMVKNRIHDLYTWEANLDEVYADAESTQLDEMVLKNPTITLRRWTGPVRAEDGTIIGRLWTFLDISSETKAKRIADSLAAAAATFDPEPSKVYHHLANVAGDHYDSTCILSVRIDNYLEFRAIGGPGKATGRTRGNPIDDSFCQFCLQSESPIIIQDARKDPVMAKLRPARARLTRYAGVPIHSPSGKPIGTLCVLDRKSDEILDESDLRFLQLLAVRISSELDRELQLSALQNDLESREESLRRTQHRLIQSEKLAVTGMLSASIAHDIRNILSAISLELTLVQDRGPSAEIVQKHLERFQVLSHRLLSYASPAEVAVKSVDLEETIESVVQLLRGHLNVSGVEIGMEKEGKIAPIHADPMRLEHLFVNLALNAIQAMSKGGKLTFRCYSDSDWTVIEVEDTGKGIPAAKLAKLFEPFKSTRVGGFGLGLYSCQQIVEGVGGNISVSSELGVGTTFTLKFPIP